MKNNDWKSALSSLLPEDYTPEEEHNDQAKETSKQSGPLRIELDRKRAGKIATIISGFTLPDGEVAELAREMKQRLGVGGSCRDGEILLQGDRRTSAADFLKAKGFKTKVIQ